mgnify:CR=1 FL=1
MTLLASVFELEYESLSLDYIIVMPQYIDITLTCSRNIDYLLFMKQWLRNCSTYKHLIYYKVKDIFYIMF